MRLGCVVRVESIGQDPTTSLWGKSCRRGATWASLAELPMAGICERWTEVLVIPGEVLSWHGELVIPF